MTGSFSDIVKRALVCTVVNIGQLTEEEQHELDSAVRRGWLSKGKGGPYPKLKIVYAHPGFDFKRDREASINLMHALAKLDGRLK